MQLYKRYVEVVQRVAKDGTKTPLFVIWDNKKYRVNKIISVTEAFSVTGGAGWKYECLIENEPRNLFFEKDARWFIESHRP